MKWTSWATLATRVTPTITLPSSHLPATGEWRSPPGASPSPSPPPFPSRYAFLPCANGCDRGIPGLLFFSTKQKYVLLLMVLCFFSFPNLSPSQLRVVVCVFEMIHHNPLYYCLLVFKSSPLEILIFNLRILWNCLKVEKNTLKTFFWQDIVSAFYLTLGNCNFIPISPSLSEKIPSSCPALRC